uniref:Uncharacterized protein n=1 Tax=Lactuca sativa TaxID=4236 RepID=A0A9R1UH88_LACSA|nr:hypothetical protein LSAT_V11C900499040 [Lactuca sativa]
MNGSTTPSIIFTRSMVLLLHATVSSEITTGEIRSLETQHSYERRENMGEEQQHQDEKANKDLGQFSKPTIQWLKHEASDTVKHRSSKMQLPITLKNQKTWSRSCEIITPKIRNRLPQYCKLTLKPDDFALDMNLVEDFI